MLAANKWYILQHSKNLDTCITYYLLRTRESKQMNFSWKWILDLEINLYTIRALILLVCNFENTTGKEKMKKIIFCNKSALIPKVVKFLPPRAITAVRCSVHWTVKLAPTYFLPPSTVAWTWKIKEFNKNTNTNRIANMKKCALLQITDSFVGFVVPKNNDWKINFVIWKAIYSARNCKNYTFFGFLLTLLVF